MKKAKNEQNEQNEQKLKKLPEQNLVHHSTCSEYHSWCSRL
jgi:hypothetical protein